MKAMRKAAALLLCLTLCFGLLGAAPAKAAESAVTFSLPVLEATAGDEISVPLRYSDNRGFGGVAVDISFDSTVLEPVYESSITQCCSTNYGYKEVNLTSGVGGNCSVLTIAIACSDNVTSAEGTLATLKFRVLANAKSGSTTLTMTLRDGIAENLADENSNAIPGSFQNGSVTVRDLEVRNGSNAIVSTLPTGNFTVTVPALGSTVILACCGEGGQLLGTQIQTVNSDHKAQFSVENKNGSVKSIRVITLSSSWLPVQNMRSMSAA